MSENVILTTGIYDLIKDHVRRKKVTQEQEKRLLEELKGASQVLRKELPEDVVSINRKVTLRDHTSNSEQEFLFVADDKAKVKKGKYSILSDFGIATVGRKAGDVVEWPFAEGDRRIEILKVEEMA
ncbi:MAG: GreA/GreB family elongation factor [Weeksellaceae bacterium]